jgi:hypothetical protein
VEVVIAEVVMNQTSAGKKTLLLFISMFILEHMLIEEAEARGRRCFGRRGRGVSARSNRNFNNFNNFNDFGRLGGRININDPFALARVPADILSSLTLDPTGSVQRLSNAPNIGVNRFNQFFELNAGNQFGIRQPLAFSNGQFFGGQFGSVNPDTLRQMQLINQSGNFDVLPVP